MKQLRSLTVLLGLTGLGVLALSCDDPCPRPDFIDVTFRIESFNGVSACWDMNCTTAVVMTVRDLTGDVVTQPCFEGPDEAVTVSLANFADYTWELDTCREVDGQCEAWVRPLNPFVLDECEDVTIFFGCQAGASTGADCSGLVSSCN